MHRWLTNVGGWKGRIKHKCGWAEMLSPSQVHVQNNRAQNLCWPSPEFTDSTMSACASAHRSAAAAHIFNWFVSGGLPQLARGGHAATGKLLASHRLVCRPSFKQPPFCSRPLSCCHHRHPSPYAAPLWGPHCGRLSRCFSPCPCPRTGSSPTWPGKGTIKPGRIVVNPFDPGGGIWQAAHSSCRLRAPRAVWAERGHAAMLIAANAVQRMRTSSWAPKHLQGRWLPGRQLPINKPCWKGMQAHARSLTCHPQPGRATGTMLL